MVLFRTSHAMVPTMSMHCRHIYQLLHEPVLISTASISKMKMYKYQESDQKYHDIKIQSLYIGVKGLLNYFYVFKK